jgi:DNA-binding GntR family transcriptional regulator
MGQNRYRAIADDVAGEIATLAPGSRVDGEHEIARRFGVGRAAARAALQELERRMLVRRVQGAGTFVSKRVEYRLTPSARPCWEQVAGPPEPGPAASGPPSVITGRRLPAEVAAVLERPAGSPAHRLCSVHHVGPAVACVAHEWVPRDVLPVPGSGTVEEMLARSGRHPAWGLRGLTLDVPDDDVRGLLRLGTGQQAWRVDGVGSDRGGAPLYHRVEWIRTDLVQVVVALDAMAVDRAA